MQVHDSLSSAPPQSRLSQSQGPVHPRRGGGLMNDAIRTAPATARNRAPIAEVLGGWLPATGLVLEIASGTGEHAVWLSQAHPALLWQPTDRDDEALASIAARRDAAGRCNLLAPLPLDASTPQRWPVRRAEAVVAINMIHIAPWRATEGLLSGAAQVLAPGGLLYLYGPFREAGVALAPGNAAFDADLRSRDPAWGLRHLDEVARLANQHGLDLAGRVTMPANNLSVALRRRLTGPTAPDLDS